MRLQKTKRSVVVQKTDICNYGQVRYNLASAMDDSGGYRLSKDFKNAVERLPSKYSKNKYIKFLDDWGTVSKDSVSY